MDQPIRKELDGETVISIRHQGSYDEIGDVYRELYKWAGDHGAKTKGDGLTIFLGSPTEFDWKSALYEVCIPVEDAPEGDSRVTVKELPSCAVASVLVKGPYSDMPARYAEMLAWLSAEGLEVTGPPREAYIVRPGTQGGDNADELVTEIQFPVGN